MNINLNKFKKVAEDEKSAILIHPSGHKVQIAKKILSPQMKKELEGLKLHMVEGGLTPEASDENLDNYRSLGAKEEAMNVAQNAPQDFPPARTRDQMLLEDQQRQPEFPAPAEDMGPPPQTKEDSFNQAVEDKYNEFKQNEAGLPEDYLKKKANDFVLGNMVQEKDSKESEANSNQATLQKHHDEGVAYVQQQNEMRAKVGLSPLPLPISPGLTQGSPAPGFPAPNVTTAPTVPAKINTNVVPAQSAEAPQKDLWSQGLSEQQEGIRQQLLGETQAGREQASALQDNVSRSQNALQEYQQQNSKLQSEREAFMNDYKNQHIDPQHYLNSMGTGQKIATGIGLILGGMGGGLLGKSNPALDFINKQMDNDIAAQKEEMGKKHNLLSANLQQFGNLKDATTMTKVMMNDILEDKLKLAAANSQDPLAQSRALAAIGKIHADTGMQMHQLNLSLLGSSGKLPVEAQGYLPPEMQSRAVKLPSGNLGLASSKEDAEKSRTSFATLDSIDSGLNRIEELMNKNGRTVWGTTANQMAEDAKTNVVLNLRQLYSLNRLNSEQLDIYEKMVSNPGAFRQERAKAQLDELRKAIADRRASEMNNFLVGPNQTPSGGPKGTELAPPNLSVIKKAKAK